MHIVIICSANDNMNWTIAGKNLFGNKIEQQLLTSNLDNTCTFIKFDIVSLRSKKLIDCSSLSAEVREASVSFFHVFPHINGTIF